MSCNLAPEQADKTRDSELAELLREAVTYSADGFESSEEISGAALVEWFSEWRVRASRALSCRVESP